MTRRLRALDGLRGLLAVYILAGHTLPFLRLPAAAGWIGGLVSHGRAAVELFFILSGMVIMRSLTAEGGWRLGAGPFLLARAGRLLPVYGIALTAAAFALSAGDPFRAMPWLPAHSPTHDIAEAAWQQPWLAHLLAHLTMTQGLLPPALLPDAEFSILGPAWSLSTEWQFYGIVAGMLAFGWRPRPAAEVWLPFLKAAMAAGALGAVLSLVPPHWQPGRAFLPHEAWYFALGIASHGLLASAGSARARLWWSLALGAALLLPWDQNRLGAVGVPLLWTACLLCEAPRVPRPARPLAALLKAAPLQWLGGISYPLYLIHMPVQRLLALALAPLAGGRWGLFTLVWGPPAVLAPLIIAYALHRWVERPCWQWSRRRARGAATGFDRVTPGASGSNTSAAGPP